MAGELAPSLHEAQSPPVRILNSSIPATKPVRPSLNATQQSSLALVFQGVRCQYVVSRIVNTAQRDFYDQDLVFSSLSDCVKSRSESWLVAVWSLPNRFRMDPRGSAKPKQECRYDFCLCADRRMVRTLLGRGQCAFKFEQHKVLRTDHAAMSNRCTSSTFVRKRIGIQVKIEVCC